MRAVLTRQAAQAAVSACHRLRPRPGCFCSGVISAGGWVADYIEWGDYDAARQHMARLLARNYGGSVANLYPSCGYALAQDGELIAFE